MVGVYIAAAPFCTLKMPFVSVRDMCQSWASHLADFLPSALRPRVSERAVVYVVPAPGK